jgi:predicted esterase
VVITLRSPGRSPAQMLGWWGGTAEHPGIAQRRGYIVIAPETAAEDQTEYHHDAATHQVTLGALDDARRRFTIDSDRIYLSGHGMGADAAFDLGFSHPDTFAGVIPFCGVCEQYCKFYLENGYGSAWYVVGGELDRDIPKRNEQIFNKILSTGSKFDFLYCEYTQRGLEMYAEELPRIFDWMALHRRRPPPNVLKYDTLRQSDHQFYWLSADELPRTVVLPQPQGENEPIRPMIIEGRIKPGGAVGNIISVKSPSKRHTIWIDPDRVDLTRRVRIEVNHLRANQFIEQDLGATLDDFFQRGDRQQLYAAKLEF